MSRYGLVLASGLLVATTGAAVAQTTAMRIRGVIQKFAGNTLTVAATSGDVDDILLVPNYTVSAIFPTTLDKVKPGSKVGIVGFGPPDRQRAAVISIFPEGANVNEAQFAWDSAPDSTMTNAPVTSEVDGNDGKQLTVTMQGQPIEVTVPPGAIIQETEPGSAAMLTPGAKVLIVAQQGADGTMTAPRVIVGKDGFTPAY